MKKILIVDDEPTIIAFVKKRLEANSFEVVTASDGKEGVAAAQQEAPDLILMDIMMPNMSGGDAVKSLKIDEKTKNIPVIFLTGVYGKKGEGNEERGINVGGTYYKSIAKPFEADELIDEINKTLN